MPYESADFIVESIHGKKDIKEIKQKLDSLHGVSSVSVSPEHNLVSVDYDSSGVSYDKIENFLNRMGYEIAADASQITTR